MEDSEDNDTVYVGNLSPEVTEEILYELFLQVGPLAKVYKPKDKVTQVSKNFAFIKFKDTCSVPYALDVLKGTKLYGRELRLSLPRNKKQGTLSSIINDERSFASHDKNYGNDSANDYKNVSNYHNSQYFDEDEHRNFHRHGSRMNNDNQSNPLPNIPFSEGSHKDFPFYLEEQLLNRAFLPSTLDSPYYASQGGTYLGGTHVTEGQGGKSHNKKHSAHKNYPHPSERSREKDSNYDRHRHHHRRHHHHRHH